MALVNMVQFCFSSFQYCGCWFSNIYFFILVIHEILVVKPLDV